MSQSSVPDSDFAISLTDTAQTGNISDGQVEQQLGQLAETISSYSLAEIEMPRKGTKRRKTTTITISKTKENSCCHHTPCPPGKDLENQEDQENQKSQENRKSLEEDWWDVADPAKVDMVRSVLHVSAMGLPGRLPSCRTPQVTAIQQWLDEHLLKGTGGSLYVSGPPGTGKSLTVAELVRRCGLSGTPVSSPPVVRLLINCMQLTEPRHVAERILVGFDVACRAQGAKKSTGKGNQGGLHDPLITVPEGHGAARGEINGRRLSMSDLDDAFTKLKRVSSRPISSVTGKRRRWSMPGAEPSHGSPAIVVILDEMDSLLSSKDGDELVGSLFSVAHSPGSRLILIGIANSIDLVQQALRPGGPFHRRNIHPAHEVFPSYKREDIAALLNERLAQLPGPVFDKNAIEFCARKIANGNGDMRRALEAASKAVEECVNIHTHMTQNGDAVVSPKADSFKVTMRHMNVALGRVTGGIGLNNENVATIRSLPVPQQVLMCTVAKLLGDVMPGRGLAVEQNPLKPVGNSNRHLMGLSCAREEPINDAPVSNLGKAWRRRSEPPYGSLKKSKELTVGDLQAAFKGLCKQIGVAEYTPAEFGTAMDLLNTLGLIRLGKGPAQKGSKRRVTLTVPEDDVMMALSDVPVLKSVVGG